MLKIVFIVYITIFSSLCVSEETVNYDIQKIITSPGFTKLSPENQQILITVLTTEDSSTQNKVLQWTQFGTEIGKSIGSAAKELNIATSEFITTTAGKWVLFLIVWHFLAGPLIHIFGSLMLIILTMWFISKYLKSARSEEITYDRQQKNWFGNSIKLSHTKSQIDNDDKTLCIVISGLMTIVILFTLFSY